MYTCIHICTYVYLWYMIYDMLYMIYDVCIHIIAYYHIVYNACVCIYVYIYIYIYIYIYTYTLIYVYIYIYTHIGVAQNQAAVVRVRGPERAWDVLSCLFLGWRSSRHLDVYLYNYLFDLPFYLIHLSVRPAVCLSFCLSFRPSVRPSIYLPIYDNTGVFSLQWRTPQVGSTATHTYDKQHDDRVEGVSATWQSIDESWIELNVVQHEVWKQAQSSANLMSSMSADE